MRAAALLVVLLAGCVARAPAPPPRQPEQACRIRPATVSDRDFLTQRTRDEFRRVNRELRRYCAG